MQAIRYKRWIELISATPFARAVITNYRQASDRRLRPCMLSERAFTLRGDNPISSNGQTGEKNRETCYFLRIRSSGIRFFAADAFTFPAP